mmetsp:Transcript_30898/g.91910  ORF Transcript_30898/g.91910 Transcript_30898/m.91910 type:complete len:95 (+) Transcript_30898:4815-5099(+)
MCQALWNRLLHGKAFGGTSFNAWPWEAQSLRATPSGAPPQNHTLDRHAKRSRNVPLCANSEAVAYPPPCGIGASGSVAKLRRLVGCAAALGMSP